MSEDVDDQRSPDPGTGYLLSRFTDSGVEVSLGGYFAHMMRRQSQIPDTERVSLIMRLDEPGSDQSVDRWSAIIASQESDPDASLMPPTESLRSISSSEPRTEAPILVEVLLGTHSDLDWVLRELSALVDDEAQMSEIEILIRKQLNAEPHDPQLRRPTPPIPTTDPASETLRVSEVYVPTVPFRGWDNVPKRKDAYYRQRLLRIIRGQRLAIWLWSEPLADNDNWNPTINEHFRGVPRISSETLGSTRFEEAIDTRFRDVADHISYTLDAIAAAFSQWQFRVMQAIADGSGVFQISEFDEIRIEMGRNGSAASVTERSLRANVYRSREDTEVLSSDWCQFLEEWELTAYGLQSRQSELAALLASLAAGLQAEQSTRLSNRFGLVAAVVLLPGLVLALFGANLDFLSDGAHGHLIQVVLWCLVTVALSSAFFVHQLDAFWRWTSSFAVVVICAAIIGAFQRLDSMLVVALAALGLSLGVLGGLGCWRMRRSQ